MSVKIVSSQQKMTVYLKGEIDHHNAAFIREEIDNAVMSQKPEVLKLDFDNVSFMDSSGIAVMINALRNMSAIGGKLYVYGLRAQPNRVFQASGIDKLIAVKEVVT